MEINIQDEKMAFENAWLVPHELEFFDFDLKKNQYLLKEQYVSDDESPIANETYHSLNSGWSMWLKAKAHEAEKLNGCVVVPKSEFALLPKTITPEIEEILGMPCFKFIKAAQIYRQLGFDIPPKAENEQSFFMFKFLHLALVHGDKCFDVFESETKAMVEAARGGNE